ncbi:MAG: hypothetical protein ABDK92_07625 [Atribacterota bacterium]
MEEEPRGLVDVLEFFRHAHFQIDHWSGGEDLFAHVSLLESHWQPVAEFGEVEDWKERQSVLCDDIEKAFFVDGRMRIYARILFGEHVLLLGELLAGYAIWDKRRGVSMGFSPQKPPSMERVLGVPEGIFQKKEIRGGVLKLAEGFVFKIEESARISRSPQDVEASQQALFNVLSRLEEQVTQELFHQGIPVIKDGVLHPNERLIFQPGIGPVGLVKRIEQLPLSAERREALFHLDRGQRTPFLSFLLEENFLKVFSYLRLTEKDERFPWKGLVRLEVLLQKEAWPAMKQELTCFFDRLAGLLPRLTADFPWRRLPENIFPIIALEDVLGQFFASPSWIQYLWVKSVWR